MVTPIQSFEYAQQKAEHFLKMYDILHDTRRRRIRRDWGDSFRSFMRWPATENFVRVDGKGSFLILKQELGISRDEFQHEYVSEMLRASIAFSVSAMDNFFHDSIVSWSWKILSYAEDDVPSELKKISLPILVTKRVIEQLKREPDSRPSFKIKTEIQKLLHKQSFQSQNDIQRAFKMLDVDDCWGKLAVLMDLQKKEIFSELNSIVRRRNQIVHEADIMPKTKAKKITRRDISRAQVQNSLDFISKFVEHSNEIINA